MIKVVESPVRAEGLSHEAFRERRLGEHSELAGSNATSRPFRRSRSERSTTASSNCTSKTRRPGGVRLGDRGEELADAAAFLEPDAGPRLIVEESVQLDEG